MAKSPTAPQKIPRLRQVGDTLSSAERWQAITKRDTTVNSFVYGVLTTKIYCRPSCGARLARRANVEFYDTPSQAEKAGFRPCKRCRPHTGGTAAQSNPQAVMVEHACKVIREEVATGLKPRLHDLAVHAGLTPSHFHRVFKKLLGVTPGQYVDSVVQNGACLSPETVSEVETSTPPTSMPSPLGFVGDWMDLNLDIGQGCALPDGIPAAGVGGISPGLADHVWNEFDVFLAVEERCSLDSAYIDPRILSGPE